MNWDTLESCKTEQKDYQETCLAKQFYFYVPILAFEWTVAILLCTYVFAILAYIYYNEFKFVYILPFSVVKSVGRLVCKQWIERENVNNVSSKMQYILHITLYTL